MKIVSEKMILNLTRSKPKEIDIKLLLEQMGIDQSKWQDEEITSVKKTNLVLSCF